MDALGNASLLSAAELVAALRQRRGRLGTTGPAGSAGSEMSRLSLFVKAMRGEQRDDLADFATGFRVQRVIEAFHTTCGTTESCEAN